jgi:hypothetical protein
VESQSRFRAALRDDVEWLVKNGLGLSVLRVRHPLCGSWDLNVIVTQSR